MSTLVPLLQTQDPELLTVLSRIGPVILKPSLISTVSSDLPYYVLADHEASPGLDQLISWLDHGAEKIIVPMSWAQELISVIPPERLLLLLDLNNGNFNAISDRIRGAVSGIVLKTPSLDFDLIDSFSHFFAGQEVHIYPTNGAVPSIPAIRTLAGSGTKLILPQSNLTLASSSNTQISVTDAFIATLTTDRPDGLFATVVSSYPQGGRSLGLVYSSAASIRESILTGKGVYHSRKHGLWRKGETSGDTQTLVRVRVDCDSDALEFSVVQHGDGFCHLKRPSCFGKLNGLAALESTLQLRLREAPEGSYTKRLFDDRDLLGSKIMEEAEELCQAQTKDEIAFEAADLIYFALTRCVASGVTIADIERSLDRKARKISRRAGDAKPKWKKDGAIEDNKAATALPVSVKSPAPIPILKDSEPIRMRTHDLTAVSTTEYVQLLRRPVLKSDEMIQKVKPIVDTVRQKGDAALLEFAAKFDKATLTSTIVRPPFAPEMMDIPGDVRDAIDVAYRNIRSFHEAQLDKAPLVVETMPGVVCTRFARPIARVGLYVPGGTAVLPSTALMLGVPAQVAGCQEIVLATPPRPDGSISPEVMYVAHLVGASAVLKAGGGQAVAAMAYGTETVPKVDKIFGPGNQWVTAAKMLVQNDTDALVSIDMPAGPSEVLVGVRMNICACMLNNTHNHPHTL
jgi:phosphoribosyl-ATP pyrophosphohydrolase / phosphoribosyl-AMP cyclohydrolase / histidinol dehydrogenase